MTDDHDRLAIVGLVTGASLVYLGAAIVGFAWGRALAAMFRGVSPRERAAR